MIKQNKKLFMLVVPVLMVAVILVGATIAYLTATDSITNEFVVGTFNYPTTDPSGDPLDLQGYLYEPSWDDTESHKLLPGATFDKDPYVGIGAGSEDGAVYVYVESNFGNNVYFTINSGWAPVTNYTTAGSAANSYQSGLFKYTAGLEADEDEDVWTTTPLFSAISISNNATSADFEVGTGNDTEIIVHSFIHQANDPSSGNAIPAATIEAAAISAFDL